MSLKMRHKYLIAATVCFIASFLLKVTGSLIASRIMVVFAILFAVINFIFIFEGVEKGNKTIWKRRR
jgi:hypothetical protein